MSEMERIVNACLESEAYKAEVVYAERGGHYRVIPKVRLYKELDNDLVRVVFFTEWDTFELGTVIAITCLYDNKDKFNIYGHTITAGPGVNPLLRASHAPLSGAHPQAGNAGHKAIARFVDLKQALWNQFVLDDLTLGNRSAGEKWVKHFWMALDRMFGQGYLHNCPDDYHWQGETPKDTSS